MLFCFMLVATESQKDAFWIFVGSRSWPRRALNFEKMLLVVFACFSARRTTAQTSVERPSGLCTPEKNAKKAKYKDLFGIFRPAVFFFARRREALEKMSESYPSVSTP